MKQCGVEICVTECVPRFQRQDQQCFQKAKGLVHRLAQPGHWEFGAVHGLAPCVVELLHLVISGLASLALCFKQAGVPGTRDLTPLNPLPGSLSHRAYTLIPHAMRVKGKIHAGTSRGGRAGMVAVARPGLRVMGSGRFIGLFRGR